MRGAAIRGLMTRGGWVTMLAILASGAVAAAECVPHVQVQRAWVRATPPGAATGAAYLRIRGACAADRLLRVTTALAQRVEMHEVTAGGDVMQMRPVATVPVPARATVDFVPGGLHLMLIGLRQPLREGSRVSLELEFARGGRVPVLAVVAGVAALEAPAPGLQAP